MIWMPAAPRPLQELTDVRLARAGVRLLIKREDRLHPIVSGNKWHKLKYNLEAAKAQEQRTLLSFGGAYSNHIHALAEAGAACGFDTIGVIRGEPCERLNPTLQFAVERGMRLHYLSRADYRRKQNREIVEALKVEFGDFYLIPEGGSNALAVKGCREIVTDIDQPFDLIATACGTGATLAGLVTGLTGDQQALGFAVLKGAAFLRDEVVELLKSATNSAYDNWSINLDYHFGGYAKTTPELFQFIADFEADHAIPLEPIYTGKMLYGLFDLIGRGVFRRGSTIVAIHTGGLQGRGSMVN